MKVFCFFFIPALFFAACTRNQSFRSARPSIEVGIYQACSIERKASWGDEYLQLSTDSTILSHFNNALGYHLQEKGYKVFNHSARHDSLAFVISTEKLVYVQRKHKEYLTSPEGKDAKLVLCKLNLKGQSRLEAPANIKPGVVQMEMVSRVEGYDHNGNFETHTSLLGLLSGESNDKVRYSGSTQKLPEGTMIDLAEELAQGLAKKIDDDIRRIWLAKKK